MDDFGGNPLADGLSQSASRAAELAAAGMMALATIARRREQQLQADEDRRRADERRQAADDLRQRLQERGRPGRPAPDSLAGFTAPAAAPPGAELGFAAEEAAIATRGRGEPDLTSTPSIDEHADLATVAERAEVLADRALAKAAELASQGAPKPGPGSLAPSGSAARTRPPARADRVSRGRSHYGSVR